MFVLSEICGCISFAGKDNTEAVWVNRHQIEWHLNKVVFEAISNQLGCCEVDLFTSGVNAQLNKFVSWKPDPFALFVDVFSGDWVDFRAYCFPPFSPLPRVLQKLEGDEADCILVVPLWTTQVWFQKLLCLLTDFPVLLPSRTDLLCCPLTGHRGQGWG